MIYDAHAQAPISSATAPSSLCPNSPSHAKAIPQIREASIPDTSHTRAEKSTRPKEKTRAHRREYSTTKSEPHRPHTALVITPSENTRPCALDFSAPPPSTVKLLKSSSCSQYDNDSPIMQPFSEPHATSMRPVPSRGNSGMKSSPLNPNSGYIPPDNGYETSSSAPGSIRKTLRGKPPFAPDILDELPEIQDYAVQAEAHDTISDMRGEADMLGILQMGMGYTNGNHSSASIGSTYKPRPDQVLGLDPHAKLASFYLVSGLPRVSRATTVYTDSTDPRTMVTGHRLIRKPHKVSARLTTRWDYSGGLIFLVLRSPAKRMTISTLRCVGIASTRGHHMPASQNQVEGGAHIRSKCLMLGRKDRRSSSTKH